MEQVVEGCRRRFLFWTGYEFWVRFQRWPYKNVIQISNQFEKRYALYTLLSNKEPPASLFPRPLSSNAFQSPRMNREPKPKVLHTDFDSAGANNDRAKQTMAIFHATN